MGFCWDGALLSTCLTSHSQSCQITAEILLNPTASFKIDNGSARRTYHCVAWIVYPAVIKPDFFLSHQGFPSYSCLWWFILKLLDVMFSMCASPAAVMAVTVAGLLMAGTFYAGLYLNGVMRQVDQNKQHRAAQQSDEILPPPPSPPPLSDILKPVVE